MGLGLLRSGQGEASTELYVDKVVKFISGALQFVLGVVIVILSHVLDLKCENHKTFTFLVLCQAASLLLILLFWYWLYGQDLTNHVQELVHHANHLTNQFRRYSEGLSRGTGRREVTEAVLHNDLDNYLEYLLHVLTLKGERLYARHLLKWVVVLLVCLLWLVGFVVTLVSCGGLPDPLYLKVLWTVPVLVLVGTLALVLFHVVHDLCQPRPHRDTFFFRAVPGAMDARLSMVVEDTYNPRCVWLLSRHCWHNAAVLCTNAGLSKSLARKFAYVSAQNRPDRWRDQHFPTLRSDQVERFQLESDLWADTGARGDAGCGQAVLWCGLDTGGQPGGAKAKTGTSKRSKVKGNRKKWDLPGDLSRRGKVGAHRGGGDGGGVVGGGGGGSYHTHPHDGDNSSGYFSSSGLRPGLHPIAEDGYMTPHLFVRKLAKESATPEQLLDEEMARDEKKNKKRGHQHGRENHTTRPSPRDDLDLHLPLPPPAATDRQDFHSHRGGGSGGRDGDGQPKPFGLSRDDTEVHYGRFYRHHDLDPHRMQREYDPLTYGVRLSVKKEMAKDVRVWK